MEIDTAGCRAYDRNYIVGVDDHPLINADVTTEGEIIQVFSAKFSLRQSPYRPAAMKSPAESPEKGGGCCTPYCKGTRRQTVDPICQRIFRALRHKEEDQCRKGQRGDNKQYPFGGKEQLPEDQLPMLHTYRSLISLASSMISKAYFFFPFASSFL